MASLSFALIASLFVQLSSGSPQGIAIGGQGTLPAAEPQVSGPAATNAPACGGCFVVADVAGFVFGTPIATITNTEVVSINLGKNGTRTTTSIVTGTAQFEFGQTGAPTGGLTAASVFTNDPTLTVSGVELTSPTAYDIFTAFAVTSTTEGSDGSCTAVNGQTTTLPSAFSVASLPGMAPADFEQMAEESFISFINRPTCSVGGINVAPTSAFSVSISSTTSTIIGSVGFTPQPVVAASTGTASQTGPASSSATPSLIVIGNQTFLPTGAGPNQTIVPFLGEATNWRANVGSSMLLWSAGLLSAAVAIFAL